MIVVDDLDADSIPISYMPQLKSLMADQGTTFENAFATDSICCPSRATILRGQYAHNHQVLTNEPPLGGWPRFRDLGHEDSTVATWLQSAGYRTVLLGKYLNYYSDKNPDQGTYVPEGWSEWYAFVGNQMNSNGTLAPYQGYETDVLADKATAYVERSAGGAQPFFMYLAPRNPHEAQNPAPRHLNLFPGVNGSLLLAGIEVEPFAREHPLKQRF
jgi:arylsulfatase A-like enzyme